MKPVKEAYIPSHPDFIVVFSTGNFSSSLKALRTFNVGEKLALLEGITKAPKAYTTVQCGPGPHDHFELNSDLVYVNHSCNPNIAFDLSSPDPSEWHIRALKRIIKGTSLTFFYPSTEWDMDQAFVCECRSSHCLGIIKGAKYLTKTELCTQQWINSWIWRLSAEKESSK
ncbi:hypothetical protein BDZ94DRAFT_1260220 [Collybia nuda]|uniref:SET domain-containing protein n=1 Tax=Collybia nuda TaxID=64659 RepID=A0A9P5Y658_9AGAR|nr:hypothetical protein BDZ94DRAFT_1260220 [Collybia nuda]